MASQQNNNYKTIRYPKSKRVFPESLIRLFRNDFSIICSPVCCVNLFLHKSFSFSIIFPFHLTINNDNYNLPSICSK